jgi:hypothetical protein
LSEQTPTGRKNQGSENAKEPPEADNVGAGDEPPDHGAADEPENSNVTSYLEPFGQESIGIVETIPRDSGKVTDRHKLDFARQILFALAVIYFLSLVVYSVDTYFCQCEAGKKIFETSSTILPPIATLVIGYYFGSKQTAG